MGLIRPLYRFYVDGKALSNEAMDRFSSVKVVDQEGVHSDRVDLVFSNRAPRVTGPRRGANVRVELGRGRDVQFVGDYIIDRVTRGYTPDTIAVSGHSADLRRQMKSPRVRHWDDASVADIVAQIAGEHGFDVAISPDVSGHVYDWIGQQDESDLSFLARLAIRHGAVFTIKQGRVLWLKSGAGQSASGAQLEAGVIDYTDIMPGTLEVTDSDVDRYQTVKAYYQDFSGSIRREVVVDGDPAAQGEKVLRDPYGSLEEAQAAARSVASEMVRGAVSMRCDLSARADLFAGQPVRFRGVDDEIDAMLFIIGSASHDLKKTSGLKTTISGALKAV